MARAGAGDGRFAAIAVEPKTLVYGFGYGYPNRAGAEARALDECRLRADHPNRCKGIVWVRNGCAAVAYKRRDGEVVKIGWGIAERKRQAADRARNAVGDNAKILTIVCAVSGEVEKAAAATGGGGSP